MSVVPLEETTTTTTNMSAADTSSLMQNSSNQRRQPSAHLLELSTAKHYTSYDALLQTILQLSFGSGSGSSYTVTVTTKCRGTSHNDNATKPTSSTAQPRRRKKRCRTDDETTTQTDASSSPVQQLQQQPVSAVLDGRLPHELAIRVANYLVIYPVDMNHVVATSCSSQRMQPDGITPIMPLSECLIESDTSWWISSEGLNIRPQYVEFDLVSAAAAATARISACRVTSVSIQIPPLPQGPMSVRTFQLMSYNSRGGGTDPLLCTTTTSAQPPPAVTTNDNDNENWKLISETPYCTVLNRIGWQTYVLPTPVDASRIRIVCLTNQIGAIGGSATTARQPTVPSQQEQVGFYCIKFD